MPSRSTFQVLLSPHRRTALVAKVGIGSQLGSALATEEGLLAASWRESPAMTLSVRPAIRTPLSIVPWGWGRRFLGNRLCASPQPEGSRSHGDQRDESDEKDQDGRAICALPGRENIRRRRGCLGG